LKAEVKATIRSNDKPHISNRREQQQLIQFSSIRDPNILILKLGNGTEKILPHHDATNGSNQKTLYTVNIT